MKTYCIWVEGYLATGMEGIPEYPKLVGAMGGESFKAACVDLCDNKEMQRRFGDYDKERNTLWGCKLFPNYEEADMTWKEHRQRVFEDNRKRAEQEAIEEYESQERAKQENIKRIQKRNENKIPSI